MFLCLGEEGSCCLSFKGVPSLKTLAIDAILCIISLVADGPLFEKWPQCFTGCLVIRLKEYRDIGTFLVNVEMIAFKSKLAVPKVSESAEACA